MTNHVYKSIELTGSSSTSVEDAVHTAVAKASKTIKNMDWLEVIQTRAEIENGKVAYWQVTLKIGFRIED